VLRTMSCSLPKGLLTRKPKILLIWTCQNRKWTVKLHRSCIQFLTRKIRALISSQMEGRRLLRIRLVWNLIRYWPHGRSLVRVRSQRQARLSRHRRFSRVLVLLPRWRKATPRSRNFSETLSCVSVWFKLVSIQVPSF
jgi:hypothetical protein